MCHTLTAINKSQSLIEAMFKVRKTPCSYNRTLYEEEKDLFNCKSSIDVYHCINDDRDRQGEICIQPVWVQPCMYLLVIYITGYFIGHFSIKTIIVSKTRHL